MSEAQVVRLEKAAISASSWWIIRRSTRSGRAFPKASSTPEPANADPAIRAMVLIGAGRSFIAGADIRGFGTGRKRPPLGSRTYDVLDRSEKPVVAAIHGFALGGGLENAMACHYRIAVPSAKVGLPEVLIGILPGGGGTQRLPRLAGPKAALDMITSGRHVPAPEALTAWHPRRGAAGRRRPALRRRRLCARHRRYAPAAPRARPARCAGRSRHVRRHAQVDRPPRAQPEGAVPLHRRGGSRLHAAVRRRARSARPSCSARNSRIPRKPARCATPSSPSARSQSCPTCRPSVKPREFHAPAVIGAGTMGGGIAMSFADFGYDVKIMDATEEALNRGMERIRDNYATSVKRGSLAQDEMERRLARIHPVAGYEDIKDSDVVVEAVFERMDVKKPVFAKLDEVMNPDALLFSNTSALDMDELAAETKRPDKVAGTHFFSPANVMKLLEVVRPSKASPETLATAMAMGRRIGKISAMAGNTDGFVANRSRAPFNGEMVILLEEGCLPEQVDKVMVDFGYPMGPFAVGDLAGLDIGAEGRKRRAAANPNYRKLPIADNLVELGRYGQKTSAGWYRYEKGDRTPHPDPEVAAIIKQVAAEMGVPQHDFTDTEILRRLLFSSVNEACRILEEGKAYRASRTST